MAASEHLNPKLFHGTAHIFADEEMIDPAKSKQNYFKIDGNYPRPELKEDWADKDTVSASTSYDRAASKAASKAERAGMLFAPVYEVPSESFTMLKDLIPRDHVNDNTKDTAISKSKVKPEKIVGWANNPSVTQEGIGDNFYTRNTR
jgi:hypothetical protein